ncbi:hypothetical protein B0I72DRAFT_37603 [Yarrowia lipolytica]|uniref:Uncharacterized protein n=1 Tax=Yarrowia lipolytica TaxID=4952 RepID=A0A371C4Y2_YARLL|nr:hypothetical protein B0I71DRAFT_44499 [Yarrowia lipolytica]RDW35393.1 hypothetical protein B0I72DRAFT_37603 [Yarrowia lipolytica]RDW39697.1 hypothetical protein B0I73DRAFT_32112 [Yarrowia lipolytica]RDW45616.1 hypothetical protein B0I74DRAFT_35412 [Yarrowia lipolytica]RDW51509.1 hypothetical protein B0I75DRAFT_42108 [Yarrowia lipolytica]
MTQLLPLRWSAILVHAYSLTHALTHFNSLSTPFNSEKHISHRLEYLRITSNQLPVSRLSPILDPPKATLRVSFRRIVLAVLALLAPTHSTVIGNMDLAATLIGNSNLRQNIISPTLL